MVSLRMRVLAFSRVVPRLFRSTIWVIQEQWVPDYIDYLVADATQSFHNRINRATTREKIVYLPNSYQVNDTKRAISEKVLYS